MTKTPSERRCKQAYSMRIAIINAKTTMAAPLFCAIALASLFVCLFFPVNVFAKNPQTVLFISSYHPLFPTFNQQIEGIQSIFRNHDIFMDIEFMDTKRFPDETNIENFQKSLSYKINHTAKYDAVIVADDNAFMFAISQQKKMFKEIPIVFLGVNNIDLALEQNSNTQITGVIESVSMKETIGCMVKLIPNATKIVALVDNTPSGQADLKHFYRCASYFPYHEFSELSLVSMTWEEYENALAGLDKTNVAILLSTYKDKNGTVLGFEEALSRIKQKLSIPLFHLWHHGMGKGLIGGKIINHKEQGKEAAKIVLEILQGKPVKMIPVTTKSPNTWIFDYQQLKAFNIKSDQLPAKSIILNEPYAFYKENRPYIQRLVVIFILLLTTIFLLSWNILCQRRSKENLKKRIMNCKKAKKNSGLPFLQVLMQLISTDLKMAYTLISMKVLQILWVTPVKRQWDDHPLSFKSGTIPKTELS
ncbi:exported hypothetical protein [Desulfamplus magnetovallimortis]|uniref:Uncharacterized protein n=1 Tax=Desulfamplus magnetovallimortis TaxID=1246637 RepID=A0A1W1HE44_9BACT|nr:exported hypothetical protein [Desulfamplus magnetovallimortis]